MTPQDIPIARASLDLFGKSGTFKLVSAGLDSTYRIISPGATVYALRVSSGLPIRRASAFQTEAEWIQALADIEWFDVPKVLLTNPGEQIGKVMDETGVERASTLVSWLPGRRCFQPAKTHARALGRIAGALHQHAKLQATLSLDSIKAWDTKRICLMPEDSSGEAKSISSQLARLIQEFYLELDQKLALVSDSEIGLINADLGMHNVLWRQGQPAIFDFNDAGIGPYAFCLARLIGRVRRNENGESLVDEILKGYTEVISLPSSYKELGRELELASEVFRLNYAVGRAERLGTGLEQSELALADELKISLERELA